MLTVQDLRSNNVKYNEYMKSTKCLFILSNTIKVVFGVGTELL